MESVNAAVKKNTSSHILRSEWTGLSEKLIAKFYPAKRLVGDSWGKSRDVHEISASEKFIIDDDYEVWAPITDASIETVQNWHSPFENAGADSVLNTLSAMLQSGVLASALNIIDSAVGTNLKNTEVGQAITNAVGRTSITKLNSTQIYLGSPPLKLSMTLHFRALKDPVSEVRAPIQLLNEWAAPEYLAPDGLITGAVKNGSKQSIFSTVYPSKAPQIIGMQYGDMTMMPMVIESISHPISGPRSSNGAMTSCSLQMTLASLTALDRRDIKNMYL